MILVVGGTGMLGSRLVTTLHERGHAVRVLTRGLTTGATVDRVNYFTGDVRDTATMRTAMTGVSAVVSAFHGMGSPLRRGLQILDRDANIRLVDVARQAGCDVVLVSVAGASSDSPMELFRMKATAEQYLLASGLPCTIVRPDAFAQLWLGLLMQSGERSHRPLVFGSANNPIGWVSVDDVVDLVGRAVTDTSLRGCTLTISGPQPLTMRELAAKVMASRGWPGQPRAVPRAALRVVASTMAMVRPQLARQARAGLAMDVIPPVDDSHIRRLLPDLPATSVDDLLTRTPIPT